MDKANAYNAANNERRVVEMPGVSGCGSELSRKIYSGINQHILTQEQVNWLAHFSARLV